MPQPKVNIAGSSGNLVSVTSNKLDVNAITTNSLVPHEYDYIALTYDGDNVTRAEYYKDWNGSSGTLVATLALDYSGSNLTSVRKT